MKCKLCKKELLVDCLIGPRHILFYDLICPNYYKPNRLMRSHTIIMADKHISGDLEMRASKNANL